MRVINNRATLDTSINFFATQFPLKAHTDKTPIIDDVTFARSGAYNAPSFSQDRRWHYNTNLTLYADHHDMKIGYMYQWYAPRYTAYGAPGPAGTVGHFYIYDDKRRAELVLDGQRTGVERERPQEPRAVLPGQVSDHVEADAQLRHSLRSVPQLLPGAAVRPERQQAMRRR